MKNVIKKILELTSKHGAWFLTAPVIAFSLVGLVLENDALLMVTTLIFIVSLGIAAIGLIGIVRHMISKTLHIMNKSNLIGLIAPFILFVFVALSGGVLVEVPSEEVRIEDGNQPNQVGPIEDINTETEIPTGNERPQEVEQKNNIAEIHFINTGNSDAILIREGNKAMLIDGGDNDDEDSLVAYLRGQGVDSLEYLIATHNHADHIGGLDAVVQELEVKNVFVSNGDATTKTYKDFITAMIDKNLSPSVPLEGKKFSLGNSYFEVFNTNGGADTNEESLVILYTNGEDRLLFTGDAEAETEREILDKMVEVDLLKVGHHGSRSSTTQAFLNKVNPEIAVITVGRGNSYGHPHKEVMERLKAEGIEVHRTDECDHIIFESTGNGIKTSCEVGSYTPGQSTDNNSPSSNGTLNTSNNGANVSSSLDNKEISSSEVSQPNEVQEKPSNFNPNQEVVYWTPNGKSYHRSKSCSALAKSKTILEGTISESGKYDPCDRCY